MSNEVRPVPGRGRGVFATRAYKKGELIEVAPVVVIPRRDWPLLQQTVLREYLFDWDHAGGALALGHGSLYNHSATPNVDSEPSKPTRSIRFVALRAIKRGEELTFDYTGGLPGTTVWFKQR